MKADTAHIFWDNSNIFIGARDACERHEDADRRWDVRIDFRDLLRFAAAGRTIEQAVAVGSIPPGMRAVWDSMRHQGVEVELFERGAESGKEQAVDEVLRLKMMHALVDHDPAVAVLLTGDGHFLPEVERMLDGGWGVEVLSFEDNLNRDLRAIATGRGGRGKYVLLDPWYRQLVYLEGGLLSPPRSRYPLDMADRPKV